MTWREIYETLKKLTIPENSIFNSFRIKLTNFRTDNDVEKLNHTWTLWITDELKKICDKSCEMWLRL